MASGATLDPGEDLTRMNRFVGGRPPGGGGQQAGGQDPMDGALEQIGAVVAARAQKRFRDQKGPDGEWPERFAPNIAGIITDLQAGKNPPARRFAFPGRPALVDTGRLRGSITWRKAGHNTVEVGSNLSYAADAQYGATHVFPITEKVKQGLAKLINQGKDIGGELAALMNEEEYQVTTPERIFVGLDDEDEKDIGRIIDRWFGGQPYEIELVD